MLIFFPTARELFIT